MLTNITIAEKRIQEILEKQNLKLGCEISFPMYKQLPDEVQLALRVLVRHGMKILSTLTPQAPKKK